MAIDMSTENTGLLVVSPRISFSHDLCHTGGDAAETTIATTTTTTTTATTTTATAETEDRRCRRDSSLLADLGNSDEFDFCISSGNIEEVQTSSAEELFSNGLIRTVHLQEKLVDGIIGSNKPRQAQAQVQVQVKGKVKVKAKAKSASLPPLPTPTNGISISTKQESLKESVSSSNSNSNSNADHQPTTSADHTKIQSKSFWRIKRSSSLHCDNKKSSFWSLPLLSRSNSTGSVPNNNNPKQHTTVKENNHSSSRQNGNNISRQQIKNLSGLPASSSSSSSSTTFYVYPLSQKPPLRRNYLGPNANGLRINPVLNVPSPHISKGTANLLGLGSFFRNGKEKKIKK